MGLLRESHSSAQSSEQLENIRSAMLECMSSLLNEAAQERPVWSKVQLAEDIQSLWYLRSNLMHLLSETCGETVAVSKVHAITELFRGHVPQAQFASSQRRS